MPDELDTILRLVADGTLSPEEAAPIIDVMSRAATGDERPRPTRRKPDAGGHDAEQHKGSRQVRIRVTEHGRQVVNLRIPIGFVDAALNFVPGIGGYQSERIRQAVAGGMVGPIIDVEEPDGDGVLISVE